ncbi:hypothetical protein ACRAWD_17775, partial [Caulobacter segnis]
MGDRPRRGFVDPGHGRRPFMSGLRFVACRHPDDPLDAGGVRRRPPASRRSRRPSSSDAFQVRSGRGGQDVISALEPDMPHGWPRAALSRSTDHRLGWHGEVPAVRGRVASSPKGGASRVR